MISLINESYRKSKYFNEIHNDIEELIYADINNFADYSINIISFLLKRFDIRTDVYKDINFKRNFGVSNERNLSICQEFCASKYLSGVGARAYNDEAKYLERNIELVYQNFQEIEYPQMSKVFIPGLSVIDALFNVGYLATKQLIIDGQRKV